jgi:peptidoglycan/xylan/chitin deacetylase (PgdA/CDA1 family)
VPRLDRFFTLYGFRALRKLLSPKSPSIPVLMYHSISDDPESGHPYFWINTSRKRFAEQMQFLKENDYTVLSLMEAVDLLHTVKDKKRSFPRYVVLTFDDGYHDFVKHAWPILAMHGFLATMFVATEFIGTRRRRFNQRDTLTWSEVRELQSQGVSFGSHTMSHPKLYGLPWNEIRRELLHSRLRLEQELQTTTPCFAYPYAFPQEDRSFVARFRQELIEQGYRTAVTTMIGVVQRGSDPLCLKRLPINDGDDGRLLEAKLTGAYDWLYGVQYISRRLKSEVSKKETI